MIAKLKTRLKREIKQHSVPRLGLHDDSSLMEIHKDGEITGRLDLAKELLKMVSKLDEIKKYTAIELNPKIEKNIPMWENSKSKYYFLIEMEVGDSVLIKNKKHFDFVNGTITNWKRKKHLQYYDAMKDRKYSHRRLKDNSYRIWRVK
jgi:hypothetical protein